MLALKTIKKHCNIDLTFTDDDLYLLDLAQITKAIILDALDREDISDIYDEEKDELKGGLRQAQLLLIGHYYANREAVSYGSPSKLPLGFEYILQQHKSYDFSKANNGVVEVEKDKWIEN